MGSSIILTKYHPSELGTFEKAEAIQISLLGGATGEQNFKETHGWWDERNQKAEFLQPTFGPETALPFDEARKLYNQQVALRVLEGYVHARSYSHIEHRFVYHDMRQTPGYEEAKTASRTS